MHVAEARFKLEQYIVDIAVGPCNLHPNDFRHELDALIAAVRAERDECIAALEAEKEEHELAFDLHHNAMMRATKMWRDANPGNELVLPDAAALELWSLEKIAALEAENARLLKENEGLWSFKQSVDVALNSGDGSYRP